MIEQRIAAYIDREALFTKSDTILVALSGGADSVALLRVLIAMGYTCKAAHCNFHLRDEESDRDEAFVRQLCQEQNIPLYTTHFQTVLYAQEKRISIEMAARELRYNWFEQVKTESGAQVIAVAHHQDDSVETLLLNLIRGTGLNGLLGIRPKNGDVVRPLLCINRDEVLEYLRTLQQTYVTDSTNLQDEYTRNKIRLNLIPLMQEINPSVKQSIMDTCSYLNDASLLYAQGIEEGKARVRTASGISITALLEEPAPSALLFEMIRPLGFNSAQVKDIIASLSGQSGKQFLSTSWRIIKDREYLLIEERSLNEENEQPDFELEREEFVYNPTYVIPRDKEIACFDADKLKGKLTIRLWKSGDRFIPFGMQGRKRVNDYLTDRKFSLAQKERQWVLCCDNQIAWLIGERTDNRFRVDEETKRMVQFRIKRT